MLQSCSAKSQVDQEAGDGDKLLMDELQEKMAPAFFDEYERLRSELGIGWVLSNNVDGLLLVGIANESYLQFSKVGEGAYGECFRVETTENSHPFLKEVVQRGFLAKKLKEGELDEIYKEAARLLLITRLGHYGIVESHTFKKCGRNNALVLCQSDSANNITMYVTMKDIPGKTLQEALDQNELTDYDKLRIVVRVADTLSFLHSYKLAHCDLNLSNIMLTQNHDPVLIDLGSMRSNLGVNYTSLDTSSYHAMIFKMYQNCRAAEIPPVVKPIFDKWEDPDHWQMTMNQLATEYFGDLAVYNTICSIRCTFGEIGTCTVPCRQHMGALFYFDFEAIQESRSFTEYLERAVMKLEEQDTRIRTYVDLSREKSKHPALKPPFKCQNVDGLHCFWEFVRQELMKPKPNEDGGD